MTTPLLKPPAAPRPAPAPPTARPISAAALDISPATRRLAQEADAAMCLDEWADDDRANSLLPLPSRLR